MNILTAPSQITSVVISENLAGATTTIKKGIHLAFVPDIIQVSHVFHEATNADATIHTITSNLITTEDGIIQSVYDGVQYAIPMVFSNNRKIDNTYEFNFSDGGLTAGIFSMNLTFIKY